MKLLAIYENGKLMALCVELVAAGTLEGELYYNFGDKEVDRREVEVDDEVWKSLEKNRESFPSGYS